MLTGLRPMDKIVKAKAKSMENIWKSKTISAMARNNTGNAGVQRCVCYTDAKSGRITK